MRKLAAAALGVLLVLFQAGIAGAQSLQTLPFSVLSTASTNCTLIDGSGQNILKWLAAVNTTTTIYYLKVYNTKATPVAGAGTPVLRIPLLPNNTNGGGLTGLGFDDSRFTLGIGFCLTGGIADSDSSNAATGVALNFGYLWQ